MGARIAPSRLMPMAQPMPVARMAGGVENGDARLQGAGIIGDIDAGHAVRQHDVGKEKIEILGFQRRPRLSDIDGDARPVSKPAQHFDDGFPHDRVVLDDE